MNNLGIMERARQLLSASGRHAGKRQAANRPPKATKLIAREGPPLVEDNQAQILLERDSAFLEGLECEAVPILHFSPLQFEVLRCSSARQMIPTVGEKNAAYIQKYACHFACFLQ